jgi:hypothetical protein
MNSAVRLTNTMFSAISFGRLLPARAFNHLDHPVEERIAGFGGDAHHDPVAQHPGAAGHGAAVAAAFAHHRRGLAGDGRFIHRGDALDDFAVGGNQFPGLANK